MLYQTIYDTMPSRIVTIDGTVYNQLTINDLITDRHERIRWRIAAEHGNFFSQSDYRGYFGSDIAFYISDCAGKVNYDQEPEMHHYLCADEGCKYCALVQDGLAHGETIDQFVSFARFIQVYPIIHDETDDTYYRDTPRFMDYEDLYYWKDTWREQSEDEYEDEYEDDDYEPSYEDRYSEGNPHGYGMADVVDARHYANVDNAWIAPDGTLYYVPDYNRHGTAHYETAEVLGFDSTDDCERHGYIHVSSYYSRSNRFHYWPNNPTTDQKATAMAYADATGTNIPDALILETEDVPVTEEITVNVFTFWQRIEESCMPRTMRDRFYPLSGD